MLLNLPHPVSQRLGIPSSVGLRARRARLLVASLVFNMNATGVPLVGQTRGQVVTTGFSQPSLAKGNPDQIFDDLLKHNKVRSVKLREYSAVRTYAVTDTQGKVQAKETVRMDYVGPDHKAFVTIEEEGSSIVRHLVLDRLMESEVSAAIGQEHRDSSITPANYRFRVLGEEDLGVHHCVVVEALPRRKDKYLFEGRIWIDSIAFAIVKIAGHPARNPSLWITQADFVREYEEIGDFWFPVKDEIFVDVKLYGRKTLTIDHRIDSINGTKTGGRSHSTCSPSVDGAMPLTLPSTSASPPIRPVPECQAFDTALSTATTHTRGSIMPSDLASLVHGDNSVVTGRKFINAKWKRKCNERF
jgi:hypothetical protein